MPGHALRCRDVLPLEPRPVRRPRAAASLHRDRCGGAERLVRRMEYRAAARGSGARSDRRGRTVPADGHRHGIPPSRRADRRIRARHPQPARRRAERDRPVVVRLPHRRGRGDQAAGAEGVRRRRGGPAARSDVATVRLDENLLAARASRTRRCRGGDRRSMTRSACAAAVAIWLWSSNAAAQQINGLAAWTLGNGTNTYDTQSYRNTGLSQNYVLGVDTPFLDRRLMKLNTEGSFRTNALTSGPEREALRADQRAVGYKLGASMFPQRPFPLTVQASRDIIDESADYPSSAAIRGGVALPAGAIAPALQTTARTLAANWQLSAGALPRVEVGYTAENLATAGSGYGAAQQHESLHAGVSKQSARLRNTFRYDRNSIDNQQSSAYNQRNLDMDYEFGALLGARTRMNVHTGRRRMSSLFDLPATVIDPAAGAYAVPSRGDNDVRYVISNISFEPVTRFSIDATASLDRQRAAPASTGARLAFLSTRLDAGGGLSLNATGTYGDREEVVGERAVKVLTQGGQGGATFRTGPHWLEGSVAYTGGKGMNRTPEGTTGATAAQYGQATLSSTIGWVSVSAGEDRSITRDDILDYGNTGVVRDRASLDLHPWRLGIGGSW